MTAAERRQRRAAFEALPADQQQAMRARIQMLLQRQHWTFARSYPSNPHWWSHRRAWRDADFIEVVQFIRTHGYCARFGKTSYTQLDVGEHFYWTMGWPLNHPDGRPLTVIINRKRLAQKSAPSLPFAD
jgi:hypothetical protein